MFVTTVAVTGETGLEAVIGAAGLTSAEPGAADLVLVCDPDPDALAGIDSTAPGHAILVCVDPAEDVTVLADATGRPDLVCGLRLVGKRLAEVIEGEETADGTAQAVANVMQALRRQPVRCGVPLAGTVETLDQACDVVAAGLAEIREVDLAVRLSGGEAPFAAADAAGLDTIDDPPPLVRRLVAQGRTGRAAGHGFYPYPPADADGPVIAVAEGAVTVLWLANPPANSLSPAVLESLRDAWQAVTTPAVVVASANPALFCAGADIKAFTQLGGAEDARAMAAEAHELFAGWERSRVVTIAAVNGLALGGGCELAMACDVRLAAESATFGQPEIDLGIIPGFGGTQRLPKLVGHAKALEMNLSGQAISAADAYAHGLVNDVVADHELFEVALNWAAKLAGQAPVAVEQIKRAAGRGTDAELDGFAAAFGSADAREGIGAFLEKRRPAWSGE